ELDGTVPLLDEVAGREEQRDRQEAAEDSFGRTEKKDAFEEIDFGSFFQDYLDPGYRSPEAENFERPSFEHFLSRPTTLTDHLMWQLGATNCSPAVRAAAELVIGNLDEDGYLVASDDELLAAAYSGPKRTPVDGPQAVAEPAAHPAETASESGMGGTPPPLAFSAASQAGGNIAALAASAEGSELQSESPGGVAVAEAAPEAVSENAPPAQAANRLFSLRDLHEAIALVRQLDPVGVASRDLRECLLAQLEYQSKVRSEQARRSQNGTADALADATAIVSEHLRALQNKQFREIAKAMGRPLEAVMRAVEYIKTLDPKPGLRYNRVEPRLIEPDVAFIKQSDEYIVVLNDDDVPQLRLNTSYKRLLNRDAAEKDVRNYVKERYKSAIQLIKNIEQRKQTILKVCYAIIGRQREFLDKGIDYLKPMMIKEVAEEIGVHPSTVSRAVANKYAHTPQGVFELRYFFSESVQGPEGGNTSLLILERRVKKLIDEEDPARPLTDEQITRILQSQGIQVTRRTVAKYREDMKIPSTHQRRVKN